MKVRQTPHNRELCARIAAKYGFLPAPKDHPVYSEGPTITFVSGKDEPASPPEKGGAK